ncbi:glutathione peroxidase [Paenibacillus pinistramenti]|uniref:glutathione peroxidase n=1 Tax=Paenibacillus pinistramenti TaxID=1768003 RepID=UPI0011087A3C|nr:glutathione peroxidase [Paenibacillus pinistramenti]
MSIYDFTVHSASGIPVKLSDYKGKVLLIVNTASRCGYSKQFKGLQLLYDTFQDQGFEILGFPCNQFNDKEPGPSEEIQAYCEKQFGVTFPLFDKVEVRGPAAHPLFQFLIREEPFKGFDTQTADGLWMRDFMLEKYPEIYAGDGVKWNFTKFLISRSGQAAGRYEPPVAPEDLRDVVQSLL